MSKADFDAIFLKNRVKF